eukprot:jgi/Ulvmu1/5421/UM022_0216.1
MPHAADASSVHPAGCSARQLCVPGMGHAPGTIFSFSTIQSELMTPRSCASALEPGMVDGVGISATAVGAGGSSVAIEVDGSLRTGGQMSRCGGGAHSAEPLHDVGQLGFPGSTSGGSVRNVIHNATFIAADAGRFHMAAIASDGRLFTWGLNDFGQLGRAARDAAMQPCTSGHTCHDPSLVPASDIVEMVVAVAAGPYYTVAVTASGVVYTAGLNLWQWSGVGAQQ